MIFGTTGNLTILRHAHHAIKHWAHGEFSDPPVNDPTIVHNPSTTAPNFKTRESVLIVR